MADENRRRNATVMLVRRDTLAGAVRLPWPDLTERRTSLWEPVPVGRDEGGEVISVKLTGRNLLLGGEPGSGKTGVVSLLLSAAAMDPEADLWLLDSRWSELAPFHGLAEGVATPAATPPGRC